MEDGGGTDGDGNRGKRRGIKKSERPREPAEREPVRARATDTWESVALENHLIPFNEYLSP